MKGFKHRPLISPYKYAYTKYDVKHDVQKVANYSTVTVGIDGF